MKGLAGLLRIQIVALISFALAWLLSACAANTVQLERPATMSPRVLALYNEGAVLFQKKDFKGSRGRYQEALKEAQALGDCSAGILVQEADGEIA